jgi:hypothetical protein
MLWSGKTFPLGKDLYTRGLHCRKSLYLHKWRPELRGDPKGAAVDLWKSGSAVGDCARGLFPGGVAIPSDGLTGEERVAMTQGEIERGTRVIYDAAFSRHGVRVQVDILVLVRGYWNLYGVKSTTSAKAHHLEEMAVQYHVLSGCGIPLHKVFLVHIDSRYLRRGEIVPEELFILRDVSGGVREKLPFLAGRLSEMRKVLRGKEPGTDIGPHCVSPYVCDFREHCWRHVPDPSIFSLRGKGIDKWGLYRKGIVDLGDVPLDEMNATQRMQVEYFLGRMEHADSGRILEFLGHLRYPLCFLDFETFGSGVPLYDDTRPYQQIPFQYSLHRIDAAGEEARHFEFLAGPGDDPRAEIAERLIHEVPEGACVVAYGMGFERRVLTEMGKLLPQARKRLLSIADSLVDMMDLFRRRDIYHWAMNGSYSLKTVLPTLVPEMTYKGLEIRDGRMASEAYFTMGELSDSGERAKLRAALLEYCRQDTLGLVRLLEKIRAMAGADTDVRHVHNLEFAGLSPG